MTEIGLFLQRFELFLTLRTLFFSVPALIVLIGGYFVSPEGRTLDETLEPGSSSMLSNEWPSNKDEDLVRCVAIKHETILDLLEGRLTFEEAIDRFRLNSTTNPAGANEADARFIQQVISFARVHAARDPRRHQTACSEIESAARTLIRSTENAGRDDSGVPFGS